MSTVPSGSEMPAAALRADADPTGAAFPFPDNLSDILSSSSRLSFTHGTTPANGMSQYSRNIESPGSRSPTSPRNLLMIRPFTRARSSGRISCTVPKSCAKTPPGSMFPTRSTGASTISASPILTKSPSRRLISTGLPAPSITITSAFSRSLL